MHTTAGPALALLVVALIVRRQLRTRPVRAAAPLIGTAVLGVLGVVALTFGVASATEHHPLTAPTVALVVLTLALAVPLGVVRARTVRVWRGPDGGALRKGTALTTALWLVSAAVHAAMAQWIDHTATGGLLGLSTLHLYLAVTYTVQALLVRRRAARLTAEPAEPAGSATGTATDPATGAAA
ncbi:hypothetical protein ACH4Q6_03455 [Streptomyces lydicus]|uniref:hypothetical protein n=1 Tax=Streptomyces lydicus TaxID=47763 RepID=UPI0037B2C826